MYLHFSIAVTPVGLEEIRPLFRNAFKMYLVDNFLSGDFRS